MSGHLGGDRRWYDAGLYGPDTMAEHLRAGVEHHPATTMEFVGGEHEATTCLAEVGAAALRLAGGLASLGVEPGDVIAVWVPNWVEGAVTYQAAWLLGAIVVPIIHIYGPHEVGFVLQQSGARVLVMPDRWRDIDYRERFASIVVPNAVEHVVVVGESAVGEVAWTDLAGHDPMPHAPPSWSADDVCLIVYTSGTTGSPKGVQHTTNTLVAEVRTVAAASDWGLGGGGDATHAVHLAAFPAGHIAGVIGLLRTVLLGLSTIVMDRWDARLAARLVDERGVSATSGAPIFLASLLDAAERDGRDLSSLRSYLVGAGSVPRSLVERADAIGIPVFRSYGSTEHPVVTIGRTSDSLDQRAGTDGTPTLGNEIRLVDVDGRDVRIGADGEIVTRGPELFVGYTDPELDADAFFDDGWYRTGDIGRLDSDGHLTITDRLKDLIIRGGENIASKEVEDLLATHRDVVEVAAVGMPDERYGERVAVFVRLQSGSTLDLDDVAAHFAAAGVARQKTPEHLVVVDDFVRTPSGKIRKDILRTRL